MRARKIIDYATRAARLHGFRGLANLARTFATLRSEPEQVSSQIVTAVIEPTLRCNLDCPSCSRPLRERTQEEMSLERFRAVLDQMPLLQRLLLQGVGEPMLAASFYELLAEAKRRGIFVYFHCNGTLLNERAEERMLSAGPPDLMRFSIDGGSREVFELTRRGADFDVFCRNVRRFVERVRPMDLPQVEAWTVVSRLNLGELARIVDLAAELGLRRHHFQALHAWGRPEGTTEPVELEAADRALLGAAIAEARAAAARAGSVLEWHGELAHIDGPPRAAGSADLAGCPEPREPAALSRRCQWPWYATYVTVEGFVTPCCVQGSDPRVVLLGDLNEQSLPEVWNGEPYRRFRRELREGPAPTICRTCPAYHEPPLI